MEGCRYRGRPSLMYQDDEMFRCCPKVGLRVVATGEFVKRVMNVKEAGQIYKDRDICDLALGSPCLLYKRFGLKICMLYMGKLHAGTMKLKIPC